MGFGYDAASRVTSQTRPDPQVIGFGYDAVGNVTAVTPPDRPAHTFSMTPVNLLEQYQPPAVGGPSATSYAYSVDKELEQVTRPDGQGLSAHYDAAGRLQTLTTPAGTTTYTYDPTSGLIS